MIEIYDLKNWDDYDEEYENERFIEYWILGNASTPTGEIDPRVVVFHNLETDDKHFAKIRISSDGESFELTEMEQLGTPSST